MRKIFAFLTAVLLSLCMILPAWADVAISPAERILYDLPAILIAVLAIALIILAAALIIRAILKKKKNGRK